jgi:hypothetical protein
MSFSFLQHRYKREFFFIIIVFPLNFKRTIYKSNISLFSQLLLFIFGISINVCSFLSAIRFFSSMFPFYVCSLDLHLIYVFDGIEEIFCKDGAFSVGKSSPSNYEVFCIFCLILCLSLYVLVSFFLLYSNIYRDEKKLTNTLKLTHKNKQNTQEI